MRKIVKRYFILSLLICSVLLCNNFCFAESTAKVGNNEYTWYNLPDGLTPQVPPSSEHVSEIKNMKSTVYGLFGDVAKGSCSYGVASKDGFEYCKDQLGTSYNITPAFDEAAEKGIIPRVVATAYSKNGKKFEIPRGTLIYIKSNVSGVEDYGYAIVADTGGAVEKGELDLYMPYAANNTKENAAEKFNFGLDYRQLLKLDKSNSITVYITKYTLTRDKYIYMAPKGTIVDNASSTTSDNNESSGVNKKVIYNTTKSVVTSGTKPSPMTTNCKDAVELYWSKTTSLSGDGSMDSLSESNVGSTLMPGDADTVTTLAGTFPKYRQISPAEWASWQYSDKTISYQACGPSSISIILSGLGLVIPGYDGASLHGNSSPKDGFMTPPEVCAYALAVGGHVAGAGMSWAFPKKVMSNFGVEVVELGAGQAGQVLELLKQGYCGIASTSKGYFTGGGHIIAVVGANPDDGGNTIGIVDPAGPQRDGFYTVAQLNGNAAMPSGKGKNGSTQANVKKWWIFKYKNPNAGQTAQTGNGSANFSAKQKPSGKDAIDRTLDSMNDLEIMSRLIYGEQGGCSFESQVLVGISVLNRGPSVKATAKSRYGNGKYYQYNCIEDNKFWQAIPQECVNAANKAIQAKSKGTYKVVSLTTNSSTEAINVYGFYSQSSTNFKSKWNNWSLKVVLKNPRNYTGFYVR